MMSVSTRQYTTMLSVLTCCTCGVPFGLSEEHRRDLVHTGGDFYCPNGHKQHFGKRQELEEQVRNLQASNQTLRTLWREEEGRHKVTQRQLSAKKGQITKMKKRSAAGVCPCCNRTFQQLARHMQSQHPDYGHEEG